MDLIFFIVSPVVLRFRFVTKPMLTHKRKKFRSCMSDMYVLLKYGLIARNATVLQSLLGIKLGF